MQGCAVGSSTPPTSGWFPEHARQHVFHAKVLPAQMIHGTSHPMHIVMWSSGKRYTELREALHGAQGSVTRNGPVKL